MLIELFGSLPYLGSAIEELTYHELFGFAGDARSVLRDKCTIALELELAATGARVVSYSEAMTFPCVPVILPHLHQVANRGDLLTDEVVHGVVIVSRVRLDRLDVIRVAPASLSCQTALPSKVVEHLGELLEVASLRVPAPDQGARLRKFLHHLVHSW